MSGKHIPTQDIIQAFKDYYDHTGVSPRWGVEGKNNTFNFSEHTVVRRFGSWDKALIAAGLHSNLPIARYGKCLCCGKSFKIKWGDQRFCSQSCGATVTNQKRVVQKACKECGEPHKRHSDYCSLACRRLAWQKAKLLQWESLAYEGDYRAATFNKIRYWARTLYLEVYELPRACAICGYSKHIQVAHVRAISSFPPTATLAEVNAPLNLVALCPNHHWEFDHNTLEPADVEKLFLADER